MEIEINASIAQGAMTVGTEARQGLLFLVTFYDYELKQKIAFLVQANSRDQAKRIVKRYCLENHMFAGYEHETFLHSHLLVVDNEHLLQRIDTLVL